MSKLQLNLDALRVESFDTDTPAAEAHVAAIPRTLDRSCLWSCPLACS